MPDAIVSDYPGEEVLDLDSLFCNICHLCTLRRQRACRRLRFAEDGPIARRDSLRLASSLKAIVK